MLESRRIAEGTAPVVWRLVNSNANWTGTWSYAPSTSSAFAAEPGWIVTKEDLAGWKLPDRAYEGETLIYTAPSVDYVFCSFKEWHLTSSLCAFLQKRLSLYYKTR